MTFDQVAAFAIVAIMMALFVWDRLRYDLVATLALFAAVMIGIVPADEAFSGFSDDIVIIIASALVVSAAVAKSGIAEVALRPLKPYLNSLRAQVFVLVLAVMLMSTFIKNVGALAILMPVAFQMAKRSGTSPSQLLMPLAFGSLLGGLITLIGTSPNVIVARMRVELGGEPFRMFDFAPVGLGLAALGLIWISFACAWLPKRHGAGALNTAIDIEDYVVEASVPAESPLVGKAPHEVEALAEGEARVTSIVRDDTRHLHPDRNVALKEGDVLLIKGDPEDLERAIARSGLHLPGQDGDADGKEPKEAEKEAADTTGEHETQAGQQIATADPLAGNKSMEEGDREEENEQEGETEDDDQADEDDVGVIEGVITTDSALIYNTPVEINLRSRFGLNLIAISRSGENLTQRLREVRFRAGDVLVLQGRFDRMPDALKALGILPLAERDVVLGRNRQRYVSLLVVIVAMAAVGFELLPVALAFFGAALVILLAKSLSLREVYETVEWPIIVLIGALIPVSEAVRSTGASDLIAGWLSHLAGALPALGALALILVAAMAVTPFLNNAATVLMMAPIAASLAGQLGLNADPFLMAVAVGAACDFLTPFGHQCNTLVMGPGGYRFADYWKFGLPLSALVVLAGVPLVAWIWKLGPA
jgi:di/tricarboxylate transporter